MTLSKQQEKEILQVHETYWDSYLKGNVEVMASLLVEGYSQVGSAETEVFFNKKDAVQFLHDTIDQVAGKLEMRNRKTDLEALEKEILIHELCDLYALANGEWVFYSKFRASTLIQHNNERWMIIHQHSSFPDNKAEEGQNIALDKITQENQQLRDAVKRRTIELEHKNRDLEIEAALERVRSVAMSMGKAADLLQVCKALFTELKLLHFSHLRNAIIHSYRDEEKYFTDYDYSDFTSGHISKIPYSGNSIIERFVSDIRKSKDAFAEASITGEELKMWKSFRDANNEAPDERLSNADALYYYFYSIGDAAIGISTFAAIPADKQEILKRFRNVFDLAYQRYVDINKAAAQAREAQIELGLERVRARAMSMQVSGELKDLIGTVFTELTRLDLVLTRCIIMIFDPATKGSTWWMANSEDAGNPIGLFVKYHKLPPYVAYVHAWDQRNLKFEYILEGADKEGWDDFIFTETGLSNLPDFVIAGMRAPDRVYLTGSFNNFGCLTLASLDRLSEEHTEILLRFAKVFDLTYTRFNDLEKAEALAEKASQDLILLKQEKKRTEDALADLKATQKQLIQSEKMASLGELTAGIAHEIQNPLNFVNNFSEVSMELLDEMKEAFETGQTADAKAIMEEVIRNLGKITQHGKRADGIVKGMLQHSRSSSGQKVLTDINALCDEYLRLAYHGLRAKDKSFNATLKTGFDNNIGMINIVAQDIGRVILNLITNAFYAVREKQKESTPDYHPTVTVTTKLHKSSSGDLQTVIKVSDNGNGVPLDIIEKIFQPFFTTKPSGQGTGLGLSLSYDIVKAHGGELKVESVTPGTSSKVDTGTAFTIILPMSKA